MTAKRDLSRRMFCVEPAEWQFYRRNGSTQNMRRDNSRFGGMIRLWKRLPLSLTRLLGPIIVRGIP